jgi:hypothetical protein
MTVPCGAGIPAREKSTPKCGAGAPAREKPTTKSDKGALAREGSWVAQRFSAAITASLQLGALAPEGESFQ